MISGQTLRVCPEGKTATHQPVVAQGHAFSGSCSGILLRPMVEEEGAFHVRGAACSRISGADDAEIARIDLGNHAFSEGFALRQG